MAHCVIQLVGGQKLPGEKNRDVEKSLGMLIRNDV